MKFLKLLIAIVLLLSANTYSETLFNQNPLKEPLGKNVLAKAIETDDVDAVQKLFNQHVSEYPEIKFTSKRIYCVSEYNINDYITSAPLIDVAAFFNSIKTFKFLLQNEASLTTETMNFNSMYRHQGDREIFDTCESEHIKPDNEILNRALTARNFELFKHICQNYPCNEYTYKSYDRFICIYTPNIFVNPKSIQHKAFKEVRSEFAKIYPVVAENFPNDDINSLSKIEKALDVYFRLSNKPWSYKDCTGKLDLPIFENYSLKLHPEDSIEDAMVKTAGGIFQGKKLSFQAFSDALINIFNDEEMIKNFLNSTYDESYHFGMIDFFDTLDKIEADYFYKNCFLETFKIHSKSEGYYMIKFWKSWLEETNNQYLCCSFIQNQLDNFQIPPSDTAGFFEALEMLKLIFLVHG